MKNDWATEFIQFNNYHDKSVRGKWYVRGCPKEEFPEVLYPPFVPF